MSRALQRWLLLIVVSATSLFYLLHLSSSDASFASPWSLISSEQRSIDWSKVVQQYPLTSFTQLPSGPPKELRKVQAQRFPSESGEQTLERQKRCDAVKEVFLRSWNAYKEHAWGHDEFAPLTMAWKDHFGGWGATLVDALDTLLIMNLDDEFKEAITTLKSVDFSITHVKTLNVFETTIRFLGGLLSAHELAAGKDDGVALQKAKELGEMLYHAFDTSNRMPVTRWFWKHTADGIPQEPHSYTLAAELASMSLEFTRLSQITGDPKYYDAVQRVSDVLEREQQRTKLPGLWPVIFNAQSQSFGDDGTFTLGGRADSMYEYIPKEYILLGGQSEQYQHMYTSFIEKAKEHIFFRPMVKNRDILISGMTTVETSGDIKLKPEGQHLSCFVGGMVALASKVFGRPDDLDVARKLVDGCVWAYESTPSGIMPEVFMVLDSGKEKKNKWDKKKWLKGVNDQHVIGGQDEVKDMAARAEKIIDAMRLPEGMTAIPDRRYILRPEAIESVFVLYRITGEKKYQDIAWKMFKSITEATKTELSYSSIPDVTIPDQSRSDASESFWMAETLKYFYLIFADPNIISLDDWVFNTEAHPFKIPKRMMAT